MIHTILNALFPVAFLVFLGWFAGNKSLIEKSSRHGFSTYVINFSFPCLLFVVTSKTNPAHFAHVDIFALFLLGLMGMYFLAWLFYKCFFRQAAPESGQSSFLCSFPDMAFMGVPIFLSMFGQQSLVFIAIGNIVTSLLMIPLTSVLLSMKSAGKESGITQLKNVFLMIIKKPLVIAPILGVLFAYFHIHYPKIILDALQLIGNTTSGVSLFTLGIIISSYKFLFNKRIVLTVLLKNIIHPLWMFLLVLLFHFSGVDAKESILLCAMPTATMCAMFALKYDVLVDESAAVTMLSTIFALVTLPIWITLVHGL